MHSTAASVPPSVRLLFTERDRWGAYSTDRRRKTAGGRRRGGCCKSSFWRGKGAGCCIIVPPYRPTFGGTEAEETLEGGGKKSREPPSLPPSEFPFCCCQQRTSGRTDAQPPTSLPPSSPPPSTFVRLTAQTGCGGGIRLRLSLPRTFQAKATDPKQKTLPLQSPCRAPPGPTQAKGAQIESSFFPSSDADMATSVLIRICESHAKTV